MRRLFVFIVTILLAQTISFADDTPRIYVEYYKETGIYKIVTKLEFFGEGFYSNNLFRSWIVKYWCRQIEKYWNEHSEYFTVFEKSKKPGRIKLLFKIISKVREEDEEPTAGYYQIKVANVIKEMWKKLKGEETILVDGYRSWANPEAEEGEVSCCFANLIWGAVAAHELGHIWGLPDEYTKAPLWKRFLDGILKEFPPSIMNVTWLWFSEPKPRHYRKIYRNIKKQGWLIIEK